MRAPVGGLFRHVLDLSGELAARGHHVGIVVDSNASDGLTTTRLEAIAPNLKLGLKMVPMDRQPGLGDIKACKSVFDFARTLDLDVLHGHGAKGGAYARIVGCALRGINRKRPAVFYTPHGGSLHYRPQAIEGRALLNVERIMGYLSSGIIFESAYARRTYERLVGGRGAALRVVPNGVRPDDLVLCTPDADAADFLFIGELRSVKGVDVLLQALARLNTRRSLTAVIVGMGPEDGALRQMAKDLGIDRQVRFAGAMPARQAFRLGRAMLVPSRAESFPYVVLEAAAAGLPLIATNVGGIPEMVIGTSNKLIEPGDADALEAAMEALVAAPDLAVARAVELRNAVAQKFTVAAMTDAIVEFYREALER